MLQSLNHDSWSKKIGIKPQIGTITDYWLRTSAEIHVVLVAVAGGVVVGVVQHKHQNEITARNTCKHCTSYEYNSS